ncbi:outer membrane protein assembly factor BamC [Candidatus Poribacteria bacterium]|jgi:uncharacterized lipoprotein|nr:outer membrane protein assembly factor BamC [Candidatus Poribacteria bacterium]MBT5534126.1 outer membrane protein assembly factor BamC [Candidatus Poribacteria bacterium]MBT5713673.1 outer membrane protein assembly factor BamC [Candidatus Poribacteria bacterium]MBT7101114.1 outer membrane protein assembly factor BamC [Candidatus Poribacteria bacterium]MBT7807250.1 outer membrane protein assembly factor BamC [Candidatus Poribacteria bacterium]
MRRLALLGLCAVAVGCATHLPVIRTYSSPEPVSKADVMAAAVQVLQTRGYNMAMVNENVGVLTTEWADDTSVGTQVLSALVGDKTNQRKQIGVSVAPDAREITVTVTRQEQNDFTSWTNQERSDEQREEGDEILAEIRTHLTAAQ